MYDWRPILVWIQLLRISSDNIFYSDDRVA